MHYMTAPKWPPPLLLRKDWGEISFDCLSPGLFIIPTPQTRDGEHRPRDPQTPRDMPHPPTYSFLAHRQAPPPMIHKKSLQTNLLGHLFSIHFGPVPGPGFPNTLSIQIPIYQIPHFPADIFRQTPLIIYLMNLFRM